MHEAARLFARDRVNIEIRFDGDDAADEVGVDAVFFGGVVNQGIERGRGGRERLLVGGEHVFGIDGEDIGLGNGESAAGHGEDEIGAVVSVASDVEAFAAAEYSVVGAGGGNEEEEEGCCGEETLRKSAACATCAREARDWREAAVGTMEVRCAGHAAKKPGGRMIQGRDSRASQLSRKYCGSPRVWM